VGRAAVIIKLEVAKKEEEEEEEVADEHRREKWGRDR
jgi:hypothetical protein